MDLRFAVSAPGRIEFKKNILVVVDDNLIVIMSHNNLDGAFLLLGNGLRFDAWLNFAVDKVLDEFSDVVVRDLLVLVVGEFQVLHSFLNRKGGEFIGFKVQVSGVGPEGFGVNDSKVYFALVFDCEGFKGLR